jgi:hypothetical protein
MKTTLEIRDVTFRRAKTLAAAQGITLKELFNEALEEKLNRNETKRKAPPEWMKLAGQFKTPAQRAETRRIQRLIDEEFETIDSEHAS